MLIFVVVDKLEWVHYDSIGKVISRPPQRISSEKEYYDVISCQVNTTILQYDNNILPLSDNGRSNPFIKPKLYKTI